MRSVVGASKCLPLQSTLVLATSHQSNHAIRNAAATNYVGRSIVHQICRPQLPREICLSKTDANMER